MKIDYQDRIDDYLSFRMSEEDRLTFEKAAKEDKELQEQLSFTKTVRQALKSRNDKLARMQEWENDYEWDDYHKAATDYRATGSSYENRQETPSMHDACNAHRSSGRRFLLWVTGIAALFVAGFFLVQNLYKTDGNMDVIPLPSANDTAFRSGVDNSDIELLIDQKKYDEALSIVENKMQSLRNDSLQIEQKSYHDTEEKEYELLLVKNKVEELKWLKVQALLGLNLKDETLVLLDELRSTKGTYQVQADSLYNQIKR